MADCQSIARQIAHTQLQITATESSLRDVAKGGGANLEKELANLQQQLAQLKQQLAACTNPGVYRCDDGGAYFVRQVGDSVYWFGERADGAFANLFTGKRSGNVISGNWYDLPKGASRNSGTLSLLIDDGAGTLTRTAQSGGFGGGHWSLEQPSTNPVARVNPGFHRAQYQGDGVADLDQARVRDPGSVRRLRLRPLLLP